MKLLQEQEEAQDEEWLPSCPVIIIVFFFSFSFDAVLWGRERERALFVFFSFLLKFTGGIS